MRYDHGHPVDEGRMCTATTKAHRPSGNHALQGRPACALHSGLAEPPAARAEGMRAVAAMNKAGAEAAATAPAKMATLSDVKLVLAAEHWLKFRAERDGISRLQADFKRVLSGFKNSPTPTAWARLVSAAKPLEAAI